MKFKYYLRGCGAGILFTALVLTISFHTRGGVMTDEKAMQRASELGMVMPDGTEGLSDTQEDTQNAKPVVNMKDTQKSREDPKTGQSSEKTETQKENTDKDKNKDTDKDKNKDKNKDDKDKSSEDDKPESSEKSSEDGSGDETVSITIRRGEVCREIAEDLYSKGLVDDAEGFRKYMRDQGYDNQICVGTFELKKGMTYAQIAKVLTMK